MPNESFGDISHDGNSRSLNLSTKSKVLLPTLVPAYGVVDLPRQLSSFFPTIEILKSGELHWSGQSRLFGLSGLSGAGLTCLSGLSCGSRLSGGSWLCDQLTRKTE